MPDYRAESTSDILRRLRAEHQLRQLPPMVLAALRKRALIRLGMATEELTPAEVLLIEKHPQLLALADEEIARWDTVELGDVKINGKRILRIMLSVNQCGERADFGPHFLDMAEAPSKEFLELERYALERGGEGSQKLS